MPLVYAIISPHPPIILPSVGGDETKKVAGTIQALETAAAALGDAKPEAVFMLSPHPDHGFEVPLYYLGRHLPASLAVVQHLVNLEEYEFYYEYGRSFGRQIAADPTRYAIIASGDLSHVLTPDGPYGFDPAGPELDKLIISAVRHHKPQEILKTDPKVLENGAECGLRSVLFLLGALETATLELGAVVYEKPFGVGYLTAEFRQSDLAGAIPTLARKAIAHHLKAGKKMHAPAKLSSKLKTPAGAFVSLHEADGSLRGCIGTIIPTKSSLAAAIISNAIAAATSDPRFEPVTAGELEQLSISVDVLSPLKPVTAAMQLDPAYDGLVVTASDGRQGVLLPDIEGVETVADQDAICREKAGIGPDEPVSYKTFTVKRYQEQLDPARI